MRRTPPPLLALKVEGGGADRGLPAASKGGKGKGADALLKPPEGNTDTLILASLTLVRLLTYRV